MLGLVWYDCHKRRCVDAFAAYVDVIYYIELDLYISPDRVSPGTTDFVQNASGRIGYLVFEVGGSGNIAHLYETCRFITSDDYDMC